MIQTQQQRFARGTQGEILASYWLKENKSKIIMHLGLPEDSEIFYIHKDKDAYGKFTEKPPVNTYYMTSSNMQTNFGIDFVFGKYTPNVAFTCYFTLDVKAYYCPYFENYGTLHVTCNKETKYIKEIKIAKESYSLRTPIPKEDIGPLNIKNSKGRHIGKRLEHAMYNSYATGSLFVNINKESIVGQEYCDLPIIKTTDYLGALHKGLIKGDTYLPNDERELSNLVPSNYDDIFLGTGQHIIFTDTKAFFKGIKQYQDSLSKKADNNSEYRITEAPKYAIEKGIYFGNAIDIKIPIGVDRYLIINDPESNKEIERVKIDDIE